MDIAIINHNTCAQLQACLTTVQHESTSDVVVVDNISTDGSVNMVRSKFPWVTLYANSTNPGYGAAANHAIAACRAQYVLLLNSDTRLIPGTLEALTAYLDQHPRAAIVGPRLQNLDGSLQPSCYSFPTPFHVFLEETTLIRLIRVVPGLRNIFQRTWAHHESRVVDWVLGAAIAVRRAAFNTVGGFDESFFLYAEEVDLAYRLRAAGWETHFTPVATVVHIGGVSTQQRRAEMAVQFYRSLSHFYVRHYSPWRLTQLVLIMKTIVLARWLRDTVRQHLTIENQQRTRASENLKAWRDILRTSSTTVIGKNDKSTAER
jgi:GT2 family glycosyltransferase